MASSKEGWGRMTRRRSSTVWWLTMAALIWLIISLACWHMRAAPRISWVSAWATSFMKQRPGSSMTVRALPNMVHLPATAGIPCSLASASVTPTTAISGVL